MAGKGTKTAVGRKDAAIDGRAGAANQTAESAVPVRRGNELTAGAAVKTAKSEVPVRRGDDLTVGAAVKTAKSEGNVAKSKVPSVPPIVEEVLGTGTFSVEKFVECFDVLVEAAGGTKALRTMILALALRGRLSKQDPREQSARDALRTVTDDRTWRIEERVPKVKLDPKIEALAGIVPVPAGWVECRLDDCVQLINGRAYAQEELLSEGTPVIRIQNLNGGNGWYYSDLTLPDRQYCRKGDLLFAWSASFGPYIWDGEKAIYHYHIWKLNLSRVLDKRFFYSTLLHITDVVKEQSHGLAMLHMTKGQMERWPVLLPPLAEQKRIVARVDQLMALIDELEAKQIRKRELGARFTQASLEALTTAEGPEEFDAAWKRVVENWESSFSNASDVGELRAVCLWLALSGRIELSNSVPEGWTDTTLGSLASMVTSGSRGWKEYYSSSGAIFVRSQDIKTDALDLANPAFVTLPARVEGSRTRVQKNDLLVTITGANVGKAAHVTLDLPEAYVSQHVALIRLKDPERAPWIHRWLISPHNGRMTLSGYAYGDKPGLNLDNVKSIPIRLPPLAEQKRIVAKLAALMTLCDQLEVSLRRAGGWASKVVEAVVREMVP